MPNMYDPKAPTDQEFIRVVETDVLEKHFHQYELIHEPEEEAVRRLFKVSGDFFRNVPHMKEVSNSVLHHQVTVTTAALAHCLRWVHTACPAGDRKHLQESLGDWQSRDEKAGRLLRWGCDYMLLVINHVAWSQQLVTPRVQRHARVIEFPMQTDIDTAFLFEQCAADYAWWCRREATSPSAAIEEIFRDWLEWVATTNPELSSSFRFVTNHRNYNEIRNWIRSISFLEIQGDCSLGKYSLEQMRYVFSALYAESMCRVLLEDWHDVKHGLQNDFGSVPFEMDRKAFISSLESATEIPFTALDAIISDLTIDPNRFHCSLTETPFYKTSTNKLFYFSRLLAYLDPHQMIASALTTGQGRRAFEGISRRLEQYHLEALDKRFKEHGFSCWVEPSFQAVDGKRHTPDLVIAGKDQGRVLVVDFKNMLAPTGVAKLCKRFGECSKAVEQVRRYRRALPGSRTSDRHLERLVSDPQDVAGLVLFRVPMPVPIPKETDVYLVDMCTLGEVLAKVRHPEVGALQDALREFRRRSQPPIELGGMWQEIRVGDWCYRREAFGTKRGAPGPVGIDH